MKVSSYTGPFQEDGDDYATLDVNLELDILDPFTRKPEIHYGAIKVYGDEAIKVAIDVMNLFGVPLA